MENLHKQPPLSIESSPHIWMVLFMDYTHMMGSSRVPLTNFLWMGMHHPLQPAKMMGGGHLHRIQPASERCTIFHLNDTYNHRSCLNMQSSICCRKSKLSSFILKSVLIGYKCRDPSPWETRGTRLMVTRGTYCQPDHHHPDSPTDTYGATILSGTPQGKTNNVSASPIQGRANDAGRT